MLRGDGADIQQVKLIDGDSIKEQSRHKTQGRCSDREAANSQCRHGSFRSILHAVSLFHSLHQVGLRGTATVRDHDEPQHAFQGLITRSM